MMTVSLEHQEACVLVPFQHYLARAAGFDKVSPNIVVKNAIFTAFYGILRHFLVKFPTEFLVFSMDACVYMYIAPLNRRLCCGIFSYLPQLKRGVFYHSLEQDSIKGEDKQCQSALPFY